MPHVKEIPREATRARLSLGSARILDMYVLCMLGVKVRNMKMDFNIYGTWRRVGQLTLMMNEH